MLSCAMIRPSSRWCDKTYGLYNMTSSVPLTLLDQAKTVIDVFGNDKGSKIVFRPEKKNNTPSFLFSMEKAKRDFGFVPEYTDFKKMMEDYKKEMENPVRYVFSDRVEE